MDNEQLRKEKVCWKVSEIHMDMQELKQLIYKGEKVDIECKKAESSVSKSVYESYSAFANTKGGPLHKAIRESCVNMIIHADYMLEGTLKVIKTSEGFEITNPGVLKIPKEQIYRGGNSKARNPRMQSMLRMVGYGDNVGSGFPTILNTWAEQGWEMPELIEDTVLNQVTLILKMNLDKAAKKSGEKKVTKKTLEKQMLILDSMQYDVWYKASDFENVVSVKVSRIKELLKDLSEQGKIESTGSTKGKMYRKH